LIQATEVWMTPLPVKEVRVDTTRITLISLRLVQQGTQRETLTKFYQMSKVFLLKTKINTYSVSEQKDKNRHEPSEQFGPK